MFYLHVYVCIVHTAYENALLYFLLKIKHGASQLYLGGGEEGKYNCEAPGEGPPTL